MANLQRATAPQAQQKDRGQIVGNGWITSINKGKNAGKNGVTIAFNSGVSGIASIGSRTRLSLFPNNNQRAGRRDPDFLVVLSELPAQR